MIWLFLTGAVILSSVWAWAEKLRWDGNYTVHTRSTEVKTAAFNSDLTDGRHELCDLWEGFIVSGKIYRTKKN